MPDSPRSFDNGGLPRFPTPTLTFKSRALGALLGVHAGDCLGATLEFRTYAHARRTYPNGLRSIVGGGTFGWSAGHPTDDTDLTLAVLLAHRDHLVSGREDVVMAAGEYMLDWLHGRWPGRRVGSSPTDIGGATETGLERFEETKDPLRSGAGEGSAGNGSLMRCIPTGVFEADSVRRRELSNRISAITHNDQRCIVACIAYNEIVAALVQGANKQDALQAGLSTVKKLSGKGAEVVVQAIEHGTKVDLRKVARENPTPLVGACCGYVLESLILAIAAMMDDRAIQDILADIVSIGADADTNCAIAGGLIGARDGVESIPQEWLDKLQFRTRFEEAVQEILESSGENRDKTASS
ncbi:MAG: hypothetical protein Q9160_006263 [Pyrenula sp. 1 TL-2023]